MRKLKLEASAWTVVLVAMLIGAAAAAGTIKAWGTSDTLTAADLNGNFNHIHSTMVGGHGPRLVDGDVATSAAIATTKLAGQHNIAAAWAAVDNGTTMATGCGASPCSFFGFGVSTVTRTSAGLYVVNMSPTRTDTNFGILIQGGAGFANAAGACAVTGISTSSLNVQCQASGVNADLPFTVTVLDDN